MKFLDTRATAGALTVVGALLFAGTLFAQPTVPPPVTRQVKPTDPSKPKPPADPIRMGRSGADDERRDRTFAYTAANAGMLEVAKGRIALRISGSDEVKQFGQKMVEDHVRINNQLTSIAATKRIALPPDQPTLKDRQTLDRLKRLTGAEFDKAFIDDQVKDHEAAVDLFEREAKTGSDAELKEFAQATLPTLREHLTMIRDLRSRFGQRGTM